MHRTRLLNRRLPRPHAGRGGALRLLLLLFVRRRLCRTVPRDRGTHRRRRRVGEGLACAGYFEGARGELLCSRHGSRCALCTSISVKGDQGGCGRPFDARWMGAERVRGECAECGFALGARGSQHRSGQFGKAQTICCHRGRAGGPGRMGLPALQRQRPDQEGQGTVKRNGSGRGTWCSAEARQLAVAGRAGRGHPPYGHADGRGWGTRTPCLVCPVFDVH
mmetsp:Transcript_6730/g.17103  ORF Transcript_6730/g.17103 Transcript_6730/m.17103 type:complete len:221 (-) Transcript_6730:1239-1901(-)